jgi:hypothetical protein
MEGYPTKSGSSRVIRLSLKNTLYLIIDFYDYAQARPRFNAEPSLRIHRSPLARMPAAERSFRRIMFATRENLIGSRCHRKRFVIPTRNVPSRMWSLWCPVAPVVRAAFYSLIYVADPTFLLSRGPNQCSQCLGLGFCSGTGCSLAHCQETSSHTPSH